MKTSSPPCTAAQEPPCSSTPHVQTNTSKIWTKHMKTFFIFPPCTAAKEPPCSSTPHVQTNTSMIWTKHMKTCFIFQSSPMHCCQRAKSHKKEAGLGVTWQALKVVEDLISVLQLQLERILMILASFCTSSATKTKCTGSSWYSHAPSCSTTCSSQTKIFQIYIAANKTEVRQIQSASPFCTKQSNGSLINTITSNEPPVSLHHQKTVTHKCWARCHAYNSPAMIRRAQRSLSSESLSSEENRRDLVLCKVNVCYHITGT